MSRWLAELKNDRDGEGGRRIFDGVVTEGALGVGMNLFNGFVRVVKSYANAIISNFEDLEKILEQAVLEMNEDLTKIG